MSGMGGMSGMSGGLALGGPGWVCTQWSFGHPSISGMSGMSGMGGMSGMSGMGGNWTPPSN